KDAGEQFFRGSEKSGFDSYSFHLLFRGKGLLRTLALGDYAVSLGQGLVLWQSATWERSLDPLSIKRQAPAVGPWRSTREGGFSRGGAAVLGAGKWEAALC